MPSIRILDKNVAELIAAGEVVERPASVVKELLENAIDAGATVVTVEIQNGGVTFLRVTDNGCGIAPEDVPTAFLRHATSKVQTQSDLEAIHTLGFRGEALASVAAVSKVELLTAQKGALSGTRYIIEGGEERALEEAGCPQGTTLIIRDLFYNTPARMKFLKRDLSEGNTLAGVMDKLALSHPEVSFRLIKDGQEAMRTPGDGKLLSAIFALFGKEFADGMEPVDDQIKGIGVRGYTSHPRLTRGSRAMQHFFINSRYIRSATMTAALETAYKNEIMSGRFPCCVLMLTVPPELVDVNVHPAKTEVRFSDEKGIFDAVYRAVKSVLTGQEAVKATLPEIRVEEQSPPEQVRMIDPPPIAPVSQDIIRMNDASHIQYPVSVAIEADDIEPPPPPPISTQPLQSTVLGEAFDTYILAQCGDELLVIDKHAAHERLLYDQLKRQQGADRQMLMAPQTVTLDRQEYTALIESRDLVEQTGFELDEFGGSSLLVRAVPMQLDQEDVAGVLSEIADMLIKNKRELSVAKLDAIYHSVACKAAIKGGSRESTAEMEALVQALLEHPEVRHCPHGRPVLITLERKYLEKQFKRI